MREINGVLVTLLAISSVTAQECIPFDTFLASSSLTLNHDTASCSNGTDAVANTTRALGHACTIDACADGFAVVGVDRATFTCVNATDDEDGGNATWTRVDDADDTSPVCVGVCDAFNTISAGLFLESTDNCGGVATDLDTDAPLGTVCAVRCAATHELANASVSALTCEESGGNETAIASDWTGAVCVPKDPVYIDWHIGVGSNLVTAVDVGQTVVWNWTVSGHDYTVTSDDIHHPQDDVTFRSGVHRAPHTFAFAITEDMAGERIAYRCEVHPDSMRGILVVAGGPGGDSPASRGPSEVHWTALCVAMVLGGVWRLV